MALFSRRVLQQILDENARLLSPKQLADICKLLNTVRDDYLATEWEQAVVNAASKVGTVTYEPSLQGTRRPDLRFESTVPPLEFVADVTTVSDKGLDRDNPVYALHEELLRHLHRRKWFDDGFSVSVEAHRGSISRGSGQKVRLKLPKMPEFKKRIFNSRFHEFLTAVLNSPERKHVYRVVDTETGVHFTYNPERRRYGHINHPSYNLAFLIDQNPLYNALKSKADQLKGVTYEGLRGVFVCDAGCSALKSAGSVMNFSADEIIHYLFRQFDSISFVVTLVVHQYSEIVRLSRDIVINPRVYVNPKLTIDAKPLTKVIDEVCRLLPKPVETPGNALAELKLHNGLSGCYWGHLVMGNDVKISSRTLLELLAGTKTVQEFESDYGLKANENPFRRMLECGKLISNVSVEPVPDSDDDIIRIDFGKTDPAVSPFRIS